MEQDTTSGTGLAIGFQDVLTQVLREGAQKMLGKAIEEEVADYLDRHGQERDEHGHRLVVRNGYKPARSIQTPLGQMDVHQPRIDDRRLDEHGQRIRFTSQVLPPYLRRTKSLEELLPWLYLKGISTGDYQEALQALLGPEAPLIRQHDRAAQGGLAAGLGDLVKSVAGRQAVRLLLGRWRVLQHPPGAGSPVHSGGDGRNA